MPARYEGIKKSMRKKYPKASEKQIKTRAAKIYESTKKPSEEDIQTVAARERRGRKRYAGGGSVLGALGRAAGARMPTMPPLGTDMRAPNVPDVLGSTDRALSAARGSLRTLRKKGGLI